MNVHWNNRGDEAALLALIGAIRKVYPNCNITLPIKDTKTIVQFPEINGVSYFVGQFKTPIWDIWLSSITRGAIGKNKTLKKIVKTLKESDLIVYGPGGSVINDRFYWRKQMEYLLPFICAKLFNIPLYIAAPSIGPFDEDKPNWIRKWLLKTPEIMCVREEISKKYLKDIGIHKNVEVTIDSAFLNDIDILINQKKLEKYIKLRKFISSYEKIIGITITDFRWHVKYGKDEGLRENIENAFHGFIKKLESAGYGVLFIPQLFGNQNDHDDMNKYSCSNSFIMDDRMDANFQQFIISQLYAVIGMRYHSNIFSAKMCTPFIPIVYEEKMEGFLNLAQLNEYSIPLVDISYNAIDEKYNLLEQNYEKIKKLLQKSNPIWKRKAEKTVDHLISTIDD